MDLVALRLDSALKILKETETNYEIKYITNPKVEEDKDHFKWRVVKQSNENGIMIIYVMAEI